MKPDEARLISLQFAVDHAGDGIRPDDVPDIIRVATGYCTYLLGTVRLVFSVSVDAVPLTLTGGTMPTIPVAATDDNSTITFVVNPQDDHGQPTADQLTVTSDDTSNTVGTLTVNADTHGASVALNHVEGTFNLTFSDPNAAGVEDLVFAVTVGPGQTAALAGTAAVS